jgi:two-component system nitrogen regulation sensor histidine kinase NtrY
VSPRARLVVYVVAAHLLAGAASWPLWREQRAWLLAVELGLGASLATGLWLVGRALRPLQLVRESAELLAENDLSTRLRPVGQPEVDALVTVYNRLADSLREERRHTEEQRHLLEQILVATPSGFVVLDFDGHVERMNPAAERLLGVTEAAARGQRPEALGPAGREAQALADGQSRMIALSGGRRVRLRRGSFVDRGFSRTFLLLEELTEELLRSERRAYEKVIRTMSHEVNNTVGAAGSLLSSCLHWAPQLRPEDRRDFETALGVVKDRTAQLGAFMRGFADVVRLPEPRRTPQDPGEIARAVVTLLGPAAAEAGVELALEAQAVPPVALDRGLMEQVLVNVVKNGIEAAGRGGRVTVRLSGPRPSLEVEDTGPGLTAAAREQVFTPFFTTRDHGQGLGLTLVQEILRAHGFTFSLDGPDGGPTVFRIQLGSGLLSAVYEDAG